MAMKPKIWTGTLMGRDFQTDDVKLFQILAGDQERLAKEYPGLKDAILKSMVMIDAKRLQSNLITYFNYRVQVWSLGFDADPTPPIRVVPFGMSMDPNGPVSFA